MAQSNSEHSRHWFFGGRMVIDGEEMDTTLFKMVKATLKGVEEVRYMYRIALNEVEISRTRHTTHPSLANAPTDPKKNVARL